MKYTELYSTNGTSYFREVSIEQGIKEKLGFYSKPYAVSNMIFRESKMGDYFDWHVAPCSQYIIYLSGKVEIQASGGETRIFSQGDILFANDIAGKGHLTKILDDSRALVLR